MTAWDFFEVIVQTDEKARPASVRTAPPTKEAANWGGLGVNFDVSRATPILVEV
jgi:hypothetical protein